MSKVTILGGLGVMRLVGDIGGTNARFAIAKFASIQAMYESCRSPTMLGL